MKITHFSGPGLGQIADDDDFLGRCEGSDHLTNLEDKLFGEARFIVGIVLGNMIAPGLTRFDLRRQPAYAAQGDVLSMVKRLEAIPDGFLCAPV